MERLDVDELRIEGATRTTGASPGRRPAARHFPAKQCRWSSALKDALDRPIHVVQRLRAAGLTLACRTTRIINRLAEKTDGGMRDRRRTPNIPGLANDLASDERSLYSVAAASIRR